MSPQPYATNYCAKVVLFGAALDAGWVWLAVVFAANLALSLYYLRLLAPLYLHAGEAKPLTAEPPTLRMALVILALGALASGVFPQSWAALAQQASTLPALS